MLTPAQQNEFGSEPEAKQQREKHTPGPWHVREDWTDGIDGGPPLPHPWISTGEEGYYHDETGQGFTLSGICNFADARLIAAAPDLLAALTAFLEWHEGPGATDSPLAAQARAALERAKL